MKVSTRAAGTGLMLLSTIAWTPVRHRASSFQMPPGMAAKMMGGDFKDFETWLKSANGPTFVSYEVPVPRACSGTRRCDSNNDQTVVYIAAAVDDNTLLDPSNIPDNGLVVGYLRADKSGAGQYTERRYHVPYTGDMAYMVVLKENNVAKWHLMLDHGNNKGEQLGTGGTLKACFPTPQPPPLPYAEFHDCTGSHKNAQKAFEALRSASQNKNLTAQTSALTALHAAMRPQDEISGPAWFSCVYGCCTAE